jgi:2-oxoisovalerate dehydrogenase E1 component
MLLARALDEKMLVLLRQGKSFFHIGASGHEACQVAAAACLRPGRDWSYPYYRDLAFVLQLGMTPEEVMLCFLARAEDPNSGGRQMPAHYGHKSLRIVSQSSPTGTQFLQATGCGLGALREHADDVVYVSAGEGTCAQGDFHEAINWAARERVPVIFFIEDNKYAISVPITQQLAGASVYEMMRGYAGLERSQIDGTDLFESYAAVQQAVLRARAGDGPSLIVADVVRLLPHSSSDDQRKYRAAEELEQDRQRDPITRFERQLSERGVAGQEELARLKREVAEKVEAATQWADSRPHPDPATALDHVYPPSPKFPLPDPPDPEADPVVLVDAIKHALMEEMERDPKVYVFGQDVAGSKGGVFTATRGLTAKFGEERCFNSPLAESSIIGVAIGMALRGLKPVVEIQFGDYIWTAMMQLRNELAIMCYRSGGAWQCPVVVRVPVAGYIHGAPYHSQSIEGIFCHIPGLRVVLPSNAADAKGLLKAAIRGNEPVLFLEPKGLYRQGYARSPEPGPDYVLPLGLAAVKRAGEDITLVTYGTLVQKSLEAAQKLAEEGVEVEVIDLRTLNPLDLETVLGSVRKTGRVLIAHEDTLTGGFGADLAALIADQAFEWLDAPIRRVAAKDAPCPYNWFLEEVVLPQTADVVAALQGLAQY